MDTLMAKVEEPTALVNPPEAVMDRIHFVINNVTASNLSSKVYDVDLRVRKGGYPVYVEVNVHRHTWFSKNCVKSS